MRKRVAFQGEEGSFSELAAMKVFGRGAFTPIKARDFRGVFNAVKSKKADYGVIPIENSLAGSIHQNYDLLLEKNVWIIGEYKLRISHCLMGIPGAKLDQIKSVYSHPQALAQCDTYLRRRKIRDRIAYADTAGSAKYISECGDLTMAAIASKAAAKIYGLRVIEQNIEDYAENFTRFLFVAPKRKTIKKNLAHPKTSIVFALQNIPGALHRALSIFAIRDIDLTKIESRPMAKSPWKYIFYLDFEGSVADPAVAKALDHLGEITSLQKVLGCYPAARSLEHD